MDLYEYGSMDRVQLREFLECPAESRQIKSDMRGRWLDGSLSVVPGSELRFSSEDQFDGFMQAMDKAAKDGWLLLESDFGEELGGGAGYHLKRWRLATPKGPEHWLELEWVVEWDHGRLIVHMSNVARAVKRLVELWDGELDDHRTEGEDQMLDDLSLIGGALGYLRAHEHARLDDKAEREVGEGRCRHGVYVGGCGIDWMCGACEMDDD